MTRILTYLPGMVVIFIWIWLVIPVQAQPPGQKPPTQPPPQTQTQPPPSPAVPFQEPRSFAAEYALAIIATLLVLAVVCMPSRRQ